MDVDANESARTRFWAAGKHVLVCVLLFQAMGVLVILLGKTGIFNVERSLLDISLTMVMLAGTSTLMPAVLNIPPSPSRYYELIWSIACLTAGVVAIAMSDTGLRADLTGLVIFIGFFAFVVWVLSRMMRK